MLADTAHLRLVGTAGIAGAASVAIAAGGFQPLETALALELGLPLVKKNNYKEYDFLLCFTPEGLGLEPVDGRSGAVRVDFAAGKTRHRRVFGGGKGQQIAKAVGIQGGVRPSILDITAGLGGDAFVLASLGCSVSMAERQPVVNALLADGLVRGALDMDVGDIVAAMRLIKGDALSVMAGWHPEQKDAPQVIYLDPMFPHSGKSAQVKKEMALFRQLVGADEDADALLAPALALASHRVVVKRPRIAPDLAQHKPTYRLEGKSNRFDIYVNSSFDK
jgi:16S rRNA (guanine1516-N2)-methyltransferase